MIGETIEYLDADKTKFINYRMDNAIKIAISGSYNVNLEDLEGTNKQIVLEDVVFETGQIIEVTIEDIKYKFGILDIVKNKNNYDLLLEDRNKSSIFVVPTLGYNAEYFEYDSFLVNSYLARKELKDKMTKIFLVYRATKSNDYVALDKNLRKHSCYVDAYDFGDTDVLFEFDIPTKYLPDVAEFIKGKYSKFSPDLKSKVLNFFRKEPSTIKILKRIFNKDKTLIKERYDFDEESLEYVDEVYPKVDMDKEIINV